MTAPPMTAPRTKSAAAPRSGARARCFARGGVVFSGLLIGLTALSALPVRAATPPSDAAVVKKECGTCHYAYARDWLPAYAWKQIVDHLDDHFGENAMLDDKTRERVLSYLVGVRSTEIPLRITESDWWLRAHGGPSIKTYAEQKGFKVSNCEQCHR